MKRRISIVLAIAVVMIIATSLFSVNCFAVDEDLTTAKNNADEMAAIYPRSDDSNYRVYYDEHPWLTDFSIGLMYAGLALAILSPILSDLSNDDEVPTYILIGGVVIMSIGVYWMLVSYLLMST